MAPKKRKGKEREFNEKYESDESTGYIGKDIRVKKKTHKDTKDIHTNIGTHTYPVALDRLAECQLDDVELWLLGRLRPLGRPDSSPLWSLDLHSDE